MYQVGITIPADTYTITVGNGGASVTSTSATAGAAYNGVNGGNTVMQAGSGSTFGSVALGGGGGGTYCSATSTGDCTNTTLFPYGVTSGGSLGLSGGSSGGVAFYSWISKYQVQSGYANCAPMPAMQGSTNNNTPGGKSKHLHLSQLKCS